MTELTPVSFRKGRERAPRLSPARVPGRHDDRYWRSEEDAVLREHFPSGGAAICELHLIRLGSPKRSGTAIYQRARFLKVKTEHESGRPRQKRPDLRTPEMDARIREGWAELRGRGAVAAFADVLGIPRTELSRRALALGLTAPHKKEPSWTAPEEALLRTLPLHDLKKSSDIMREHGFQRTPTAIGVKVKRLDISRRRRDVFTGTRAARLLGIDSKTVTSWCIDCSLPATRGDTKRLPQQGGDFWIIQPADLRQFVIDHIDHIDIRKVDKLAFVDLLVSVPAAGGSHEPGARSAFVATAAPASRRPSAKVQKRPIARRSSARPRPSKRPLADILAEADRTARAKGIRTE